MEYRKLGNTGLDVSRFCLGTMGFGNPAKGNFPWSVQYDQSEKVVQKALDLGINFFDTANFYSYGDSERILGKALKENANRDEVVVATKVFFTKSDKPNQQGLSRKAILSQIDKSLQRLDMDYVDLYIIHRWDYNTPIEETMEALHDVVKSGKARYIGASAMYSWQFEKAQAVAKEHNWTEFVSMQNHLNLLYREEEREMMPLCEDQNIAVTPYSPLASGHLTRRTWNANTKRSETDEGARGKYDAAEDQDMKIVERVGEVADKHNATMAQVALAWLLQKKQVVAPIIGATKPDHLASSVDALKLKLTSEDINYLEELYLPHKVVGPLTK
ncbi:aldo/keto reductase [Companilactobacillus halodurans]|uniref:Aldo/keto reductase n=1 Tax=Companilactobacillus halodurans TaxID=2584183 RepID=A0A5P0ZQR4_9LACO|nr:aldo/keto reductase [Companilactobacillus halodurans]MQS76593.1 aldo/keto reductase [Companilactobacillus halodurans]MQS98202.1 aldo/keto reductase [Companilactobacillus halodurans]